MDRNLISLNLAGDLYDYIYYPKTRQVCTALFPDIPIVRVFIGCGHSLTHDNIRDLIEDKQKVLEELSNSFK